MNTNINANTSTIKLNDDWMVCSTPLSWGPGMSARVAALDSGWMRADLPCDVHVPLIENGLIDEPLEKDNYKKCWWIEDKAWWFKKTFMVEKGIPDHDVVELTMQSLDAEADVFLNGEHLGHQKSAFYPFISDVRDILKCGENTVLVRVTSGLENYSDNDTADLSKNVLTENEYGAPDRGDKRRAWVRKPQYVYGWDWGPRVASCGIMGEVEIKAFSKIAVRDAHVYTTGISEHADICIDIEVENASLLSTMEAVVNVIIEYENEKVLDLKKEVLLRSGINFIGFCAQVEDPKLWWPNGSGRQDLYTIKVSASSEGSGCEYPEFRFGIKTVSINMDRIEDGKRQFAFEINGVKIFAKGGNWIPADFIYSRTEDSAYHTLLNEAKEANYNILRVCGVGIYERDHFYDLCDEMGILIWQDLMFSCSLYPDRLEWFCNEVEKEIDHQTRRLRNHASMLIWGGNNECQQAIELVFFGDRTPEYMGGTKIYNHIAPRIVRENCAEIPYWNGSPYGGENPTGYEVGDHHHWDECTMNPEMEKRITPEEYDKTTGRFVSEFGYIGPCRKSSIEIYHGGLPVDRNGDVWKAHNNTHENETVPAGIRKHYIDTDNIDLDQYLLYAGLCQGLMLGYALESLRYKYNNWGALTWSFNDCWGEVGWSIIDYYLRRKISYYYVKRAFSPLKLIMRINEGEASVAGINDTADHCRFTLRYGYVSFDGKNKDISEMSLDLEPFSRSIVLKFNSEGRDLKKGCFFAAPVEDGTCGQIMQPAILRSGVFRDLDIPDADIRVSGVVRDGEKLRFTVESSTFAHAVHFGLDDDLRLSDEYFDLLPGQKRDIEILSVPAGFNVDPIRAVCVPNVERRDIE